MNWAAVELAHLRSQANRLGVRLRAHPGDEWIVAVWSNGFELTFFTFQACANRLARIQLIRAARIKKLSRSDAHEALRACEWIEVDAFAVRTTSILTAAKVASHLNRTCRRSRQAGVFDGVEWMCLARFREAIR